MSKLREELSLAIEKDLPNQVGKELIKKLEKADKDAEDLKELKEQHKVLKKAQAEVDADNAVLRKWKSNHEIRAGEVEARERLLDKREMKFELELLQMTVEHHSIRANELRSLVQDVFASPAFERRVFGSTPVQDNYGYTQTAPFDLTEVTGRKSDPTKLDIP